jgi:hypothetical protein
MKKKTKINNRVEFAPYKSYLFGLIKVPDGWEDIGEQISYGMGEYKPYHISIWGDNYSGMEEVKYFKVCNFDRRQLRLGMIKRNSQMIYYCPLCKRWWDAKDIVDGINEERKLIKSKQQNEKPNSNVGRFIKKILGNRK